MYLWHLNCVDKIYFSIIFSSMGRRSIQYVWYISLYFIWWTVTWLITDIGVVNQRLSQLPCKFYKSFICFKETFRCQICTHFSTLYVKREHSYGPPGCPPITIQTSLRLSPTIMPQCIVIVQSPVVAIMIRKHYNIIELYYLIIHNPSFLFPNPWHNQTWEGWHHRYIIIRFPCDINIKLGIILLTTKTPHITNIFVLKYSIIMSLRTPLVQYNFFLINGFSWSSLLLIHKITLRTNKLLYIITDFPVVHISLFILSMRQTIFILLLVSN